MAADITRVWHETVTGRRSNGHLPESRVHFAAANVGALHNPEFTIVEWYRVGDDQQAGMQLLDQLSQYTLQRGPAERLYVCRGVCAYVGLDPHTCLVTDLETRRLASQVPLEPPHPRRMDRDAWLDLLLVECVESRLGFQQPTILLITRQVRRRWRKSAIGRLPSQSGLSCTSTVLSWRTDITS